MSPKKLLVLAMFMAVGSLLSPSPAGGQQIMSAAYKNPDLPIETRVEDLLGRMTTEEKFWQLYMIPGDLSIGKEKLKNGIFGLQGRGDNPDPAVAEKGMLYADSIPALVSAEKMNSIQRFFMNETRLGIPVIFFEEALHGLVLPGATSFPQSIGLAATFNIPLMTEVSTAIAEECSAWGIRQVLSPVVNIATDVRWGRTEETYGEDPFLSSAMGLAYVSGFEKQGIITTPKHFIANIGDGGRDSYPVMANERDLRTTFFPPFETCIIKGGSGSLMCSYNSLDGVPCTANEWLLQTTLKERWGFKGFVISDAGAVGGANVLHFTSGGYAGSTANAFNAGLDVILQSSYDQYALFYEAFQKGMIPEARINDAVRRVLREKFSLGLFDHPYTDLHLAKDTNRIKEHRKLAKKAALESIVLLKNDRKVLPLKKGLKRIAVIGPDAVEARLGGYSGPGSGITTILEGIREELGSTSEVVYARGCERVFSEVVPVPASCLFHDTPSGAKPGLNGEYYDNVTLSGIPVFTRTDPQVRFQWTLYGPDPERLSYGFYSVRWTGHVVAPGDGTYQLGVDGNDGYRLWLDGVLLIDRSIHRTRQITTSPVVFEKGRSYELVIEYSEPRGNSWFSLVWNAGVPGNIAIQMEEAVRVASGADVVIVVAGIEEGEFRDRASLKLPGNQEEMIRRAAATGKPLVVVLVGGSAITMTNWLDSADAVIDAWYPGEAGGTAIAEVLVGDYSPAGRLPVTFPVAEGQLPLVYNHLPTGRGDDYNDLTGQPLFPFGFGLSYTTFSYSSLTIENNIISPGDTARIRFTLTNTGAFAGDEVVQVYLHDELSSVAQPVAELKAFLRVCLQPGEAKDLSIMITPEMLTILDRDLRPVIEPGNFAVMIGSSSQDIRLKGILTVTEQP
jgi:beta-glucosidase